MKVKIYFSTSLGAGCVFFPHDIRGICEVDLDDKQYEKLISLINEDGDVVDDDLYDEDKALFDVIHSSVQDYFHDLVVIDGWENHGWEACSEDPHYLMGKDKRNGDFTPEEGTDEYEQLRQWQKKEDEKLAGMSIADKADYLENYYGLATDTDGVFCGWVYDPELN